MKAIIIISLIVIALLLLLRRISGYSPQCWRANCKTEQIQDINGTLVTVPNMDCLRASSMDEYCVFTTPGWAWAGGDRPALRDDPNCWYKRAEVDAANSAVDAAQAADMAAAAEQMEADYYASLSNNNSNDSWGGNSNASIS